MLSSLSFVRKVILSSFCAIPEIGEASAKAPSERIEKAFFSVTNNKGEKQLSHQKTIGREITRERVLTCLRQAADILSLPNQKVFVIITDMVTKFAIPQATKQTERMNFGS